MKAYLYYFCIFLFVLIPSVFSGQWPQDVVLITGNDAITLDGDATQWDDMRMVPGAFQFPGVADPTLANWQPGGSGATFKVYKFQKNDEVHGIKQIPHSYLPESDLYLHVHWTPGDRGNEESGAAVGWKADISVISEGGVFLASTTYDLTDNCTGTDDYHEFTAGVLMSGTGLGISSELIVRFYRSDTGADDTWTGSTVAQSPVFLEFDIHFELNTIGSRTTTAK